MPGTYSGFDIYALDEDYRFIGHKRNLSLKINPKPSQIKHVILKYNRIAYSYLNLTVAIVANSYINENTQIEMTLPPELANTCSNKNISIFQ